MITLSSFHTQLFAFLETWYRSWFHFFLANKSWIEYHQSMWPSQINQNLTVSTEFRIQAKLSHKMQNYRREVETQLNRENLISALRAQIKIIFFFFLHRNKKYSINFCVCIKHRFSHTNKKFKHKIKKFHVKTKI